MARKPRPNHRDAPSEAVRERADGSPDSQDRLFKKSDLSRRGQQKSAAALARGKKDDYTEYKGKLPSQHEVADAALERGLRPILDDLGFGVVAKWLVGQASPDERAQIAGTVFPDYPDFLEAIEKAEREFAERKAELSKPALPRLSEVALRDIQSMMSAKPWNARNNDKGNEFRGNVFDWVYSNFAPWVGKGLLQSHLKLDPGSLYRTFVKRANQEGLPEWLDVPNDLDAAIREISDRSEKLRTLAERNLHSARLNRLRAPKR